MNDEEKVKNLPQDSPDSENVIGSDPSQSTSMRKDGVEQEIDACHARNLLEEGESQCTNSSAPTSSSIVSKSQYFPHCAVCGFNVEVYLLHYRRIKPPINTNWVFRFKCRRKKCNKFFGHHWIKNKDGEFEIATEDMTFETLPFYSAFNPNINPDEYKKIVKPRLAEQHGLTENGITRKSRSPSPTRSGSPVRGAPIKIVLTLQNPSKKIKDAEPVESPIPPEPKQRRGYAYVLEPVPEEKDPLNGKKPPKIPPKRDFKQAKAEKSKEFGVSSAPSRICDSDDNSIRCFHRWTQTCDLAHATSIGIHDVVNRIKPEYKDESTAAETSGQEAVASTSQNPNDAGTMLARRLIVASHAIDQARKSEEKMRMERDQFKDALTRILAQMRLLKRQHLEGTRRIRDDVLASRHELRTFHGELGLEADAIKHIIDDVKKAQTDKFKDLEKNSRKLRGQLELTEIKYQQVEAQSNKYHRELEERDRKVALVTAEKLEVAKNLEDKLYLTNNQKCAHCTESLNLKSFYEKQAKTKAVTVDTLEAENRKLNGELEACQQTVSLLKKSEGKLKFERDAYEADNRRLLTKLGIKKLEDENQSTNHSIVSGSKSDTTSHSSDGSKSASPQIHSSPNSHSTVQLIKTTPIQQQIVPSRSPAVSALPTFAPLSNSDQVPAAFANWIPKITPKNSEDALTMTREKTIDEEKLHKAEKKKRKLEKPENAATHSAQVVAVQNSKEPKKTPPSAAPTAQLPPVVKKPRVESPNTSNNSSVFAQSEKVNPSSQDAQQVKKVISAPPQKFQVAQPIVAKKISPPKFEAPNRPQHRPTYSHNSSKPVNKPAWLEQEGRRSGPSPFSSNPRSKPEPNFSQKTWNPQMPVPAPQVRNGPVIGPPGVSPTQDNGLPWHRSTNGPIGQPFHSAPSNDSWAPPSSNTQRRGFWE